MKFSPDRPYSDPEKAVRKIIEVANGVETVQDGRIHIEKINGPFGTYVKFSLPPAEAALLG